MDRTKRPLSFSQRLLTAELVTCWEAGSLESIERRSSSERREKGSGVLGLLGSSWVRVSSGSEGGVEERGEWRRILRAAWVRACWSFNQTSRQLRRFLDCGGGGGGWWWWLFLSGEKDM